MRHDQGGAHLLPQVRRPLTKRALREALAGDASAVRLVTTSAFGGFAGRATELPPDLSFVVVGPDPYRKRSWYASVQRKADGSITCK